MMDEFDKSLTPHLIYTIYYYYTHRVIPVSISIQIYYYPRFISTEFARITCHEDY